MSYLNRMWMAASVAVVQGHTDQGTKMNSSFKTLHHTKKRFSSSSTSSSSGTGGLDFSDLRPLSGVLGSDVDGFIGSGNGDEKRRQSEDSLRQVMYMSCWGQS